MNETSAQKCLGPFGKKKIILHFLAEEDYFTGSTLIAQPTSPSDQRPKQMPTSVRLDFFSISILFCLTDNIICFSGSDETLLLLF
jgi:hypothetical protein